MSYPRVEDRISPMKCKQEGCEGILREVGVGSMGSCHSDYYDCQKCGTRYLIDFFGRIVAKWEPKKRKETVMRSRARKDAFRPTKQERGEQWHREHHW